MTRRRDTRSIEDDLDRDRARFGSALDSLLNRSTFDLLAREASAFFRANGGYRETAEAVVRRNPVAVAVTGLGLAWLVFGSRSRTQEVEDDLSAGLRRTTRRAKTALRDEADLIAETDWAEAIDRIRARASVRLRELEEDARAYRDDVAEGLSDRAAEARDYMSERAALLADLAEDVRERFAEGLEDFSHSAQDRIIRAREEAYAARLRAEEAIGRGGREAKRLVEDHPMVSAAIALALGSAIAAAVSHRRKSHAEDEVETLADRVDHVRDRLRGKRR